MPDCQNELLNVVSYAITSPEQVLTRRWYVIPALDLHPSVRQIAQVAAE
ncbi:MAG TPA: hypothetical protein VKE41_10410 [Roseiflexaceae bacterium]|nr:hypothetical protein [Roseiflexaceae bacterium]